MTKTIDTDAPLTLPMPSEPALRAKMARRGLAQRLAGFVTSPRWLPEGLFPELDKLRAEHVRLTRRAAAELGTLNDLVARFKGEDDEYNRLLRDAVQAGMGTPEDGRTPAQQRAEQRAQAEQRLWATLEVLADYADEVVEAFRDHEDQWLAGLRDQRDQADEKMREAQRLVSEAKSELFRVHRLGQWVQAEADSQALSKQPAPALEPAPEHVAADAFRDSLERPWHRIREWSRTETTETETEEVAA